jgi:hypothetical protein
MYMGMLIVLMLVLPMASIALEVFVDHHVVLNVALAGKWFVFWAVGARLFIAGLRQIVQPRYTAETILGVKDPDATLIVRELGFANTAIGSAGLGSIYLAGWILPVAVIGSIFYGLAGINHVTHRSRNTLQTVAMTSDFFAATVLLVFCVVTTSKWLTQM